MKIAILGYGRMGQAIERIATARAHEIILKINSENKEALSAANIKDADIAIEFSDPDSAYSNLQFCAENGVNTVCGTTGWLSNYEDIIGKFENNKAAFLYASNFSIGVNIFFELNKKLAQLIKGKAYQASTDEVHHIHKKDAPSGTAISLANDLLDNSDYEKWVNHPPTSNHELPIISHREAEVYGTHIVNHISGLDMIQIKHEARSRDGFALGAVLAAEYILGKSGIYSMKDVLDI